MLKYFKDNYEDGREPVDAGLLSSILRESIKITSGNDALNIDCYKTVLLFLAGVNYYFYLHPEQYVDFGKFVAYRNVDLKNLWTLEVKDNESAKTIYEYFKNGGLEVEEIQNLVKEYVSDTLDYSSKRVQEVSGDIEKMSAVISQDNSEVTNKIKEKNYGI